MDDTTNLDVYRRQVSAAVNSNLSTPFPNASMRHARIIVEEFVKSALERIDILCGCFSRDVYGNDAVMEGIFTDAIRNRGVKVRILHCAEYIDSQGLVEVIRNLEGEVRQVTSLLEKEPMHFLVVDSKRYRIEVDESTREAIACAYSPVEGARLSNLFEQLFRLSEKAR